MNVILREDKVNEKTVWTSTSNGKSFRVYVDSNLQKEVSSMDTAIMIHKCAIVLVKMGAVI